MYRKASFTFFSSGSGKDIHGYFCQLKKKSQTSAVFIMRLAAVEYILFFLLGWCNLYAVNSCPTFSCAYHLPVFSFFVLAVCFIYEC